MSIQPDPRACILRRLTDRRSRHTRARTGFTLVELLIVIGIIAILMALLVSVAQRVRSRGRDIECQSNIRQILVAINGYVQENWGSYPYGFHWSRTRNPGGDDLQDWAEAPGNNQEFVSWPSQLGKWLNKGQLDRVENDAFSFPDILRCPQALQVRPHYLSYAMNMVVAVDPRAELTIGPPPRAMLRPATTSLMRNGNEVALIWDTAIFIHSSYDIDYLVGLDIDNQRFWQGAAIPQYRYYRDGDPFAYIPPGTFGQNQPIQLDVGSAVYRNIDPADASAGFPYQGNVRFRHGGQSTCNVGFADGHVGTFEAVMNSDKTVKSHNALRKYFMVKWPPNISPDPGTPY